MTRPLEYTSTILFYAIFIAILTLPEIAHSDKQPHFKASSVVHPLGLDEAITTRAYATVRDNQGFLWIASDNNLLRYDGYQIKEYHLQADNENQLKTERLNTLLLDPDGSIWIGSTKLIHFQPQTEVFVAYDAHNAEQPIEAIEQDSKGILWLGGQGFDLVGFNPKKKKVTHKIPISSSDYQQAHTITAIARTRSNKQLWIASGSGVLLFDTETLSFDTYPIPKSIRLGYQLTRDIIVDSNNFVWVASPEGLVRINPKTRKYKRYTYNPNDPTGLSTNDIWSVFEDTKGQIWIGTDKKGVHKYQEKTDDFLHIQSSAINSSLFPISNIIDIYEDAFGTMWFSTGFYGVRLITEHLETFTTIKHEPENTNSLSFDNTRALIQDKQGNIWIATDGGGLDRYNPQKETFKHFKFDHKNPQGLSSNSVISLAEDQEGNIWIGTWAGGVNRFNPTTKDFSHIKKQIDTNFGEGLMNNNILLTYIDSSGQLWLNPHGEGLQIYNPQNGSFQTFSPSRNHDGSTTVNTSIYKITPTSNGNYWIGGINGLELFNPKKKSFARILKDDIGGVNDLLQDGDNTLWIATSSKFLRYDIETNTIRSYTTENGLAHNNVTSIEKDKRGDFWLGTRGGLSRFSPKTESFINYDLSDGLPSTQFNTLSHLTTRNEIMYFGSTNGVVAFNPNHTPTNKQIPNIVLTNIEVSRNSKGTLEKYNPKPSIDLSKAIVLPYSERNVSFEFTALSFIAPKSNLYKYQLKGLDKHWIATDSSMRNARYTNLNPGAYTFHVIGSNNDGVWNNEGVSIKLVILPPWWLTWWAKIVFSFFFILSIYLFVHWKMRFNDRRNKALERLVEEKTNNLNLNRKLSQRITKMLENERKAVAHEVHDNINSTIIATRMITQSIERLSQEREVNTQKITQLAQKADQYLSETYDFFRALVRRLRPEIIETLGFDGAIAELVENYNNIHTTCDFHFKKEGNKTKINEDMAIGLYRITQEAITNAIKHASPTKIMISINYKNDQVCVSISDNGQGFQSESTPGLGIAHMRERALALNGQLSIQKSQGTYTGGTDVTACVPLESPI